MMLAKEGQSFWTQALRDSENPGTVGTSAHLIIVEIPSAETHAREAENMPKTGQPPGVFSEQTAYALLRPLVQSA